MGRLKGFKHSEETKKKIRKAHKGKKFSEKTKQKMRKNNAHYWKDKKRPKTSGEKHYHWKGNNIGYNGVHTWVNRTKGYPKICEHCGKIGKKIGRRWNLDWANIDHSYKRNLKDYIGLCKSCHRIYDYKYNII